MRRVSAILLLRSSDPSITFLHKWKEKGYMCANGCKRGGVSNGRLQVRSSMLCEAPPPKTVLSHPSPYRSLATIL